MNYQVFNLNIYSKSKTELKSDLLKLLKVNKSSQLLTLNIDYLRNYKKNDDFRKICENSDLILPDGHGVTSLLKIKYGKAINRITGHDLFLLLLEISNKENLKVAFLGSTEKVLAKIKTKIMNFYPNCIITNLLSPKINFEKNEVENNEIIKLLKKSKPNILFVALGSPRQDLWINKYKGEIKANINIGVGSVFDYYSGTKKRCPKYFQLLRLEWFWRLVFEPKRLFRRYIINDIPFYFITILKIIVLKIFSLQNEKKPV